jgi:hypothetical protein
MLLDINPNRLLISNMDLGHLWSPAGLGIVTFMFVLCLRLYLMQRDDDPPVWQRWLSHTIDGAGYLAYRIAEAALIAIAVGVFSQLGWIDLIIIYVSRMCGR